MAISTLILGESGTGKTCSLRNLESEGTVLLQVVSKPLPFRSSGLKTVVADNHNMIVKCIQRASSAGIKRLIIDDFQYMMANEFMRRATETGFTKFTEMAQHAHTVLNECLSARDDLRIYILSHTDQNEMGKVKCKTIGKMIDEKITMEGLFTIVLRTHVEAGQYSLSTQNNGNDTVKSPMGLFDSQFIDNDLQQIDNAIVDYYNLNGGNE